MDRPSSGRADCVSGLGRRCRHPSDKIRELTFARVEACDWCFEINGFHAQGGPSVADPVFARTIDLLRVDQQAFAEISRRAVCEELV